MIERMNEYFGYDVVKRLEQLGYKGKELKEQLFLLETLFKVTDEIQATEGVQEVKTFVNGIMVKQYLNE